MSTTNKFQYLAFTTIGISILWPWNSLLLGVAYFCNRLVDYPTLHRTTSSILMLISTLTSSTIFIYFFFKKTGKDINTTAVYSSRFIIGELIVSLAFLMLALSCIFSAHVNDVVYFLFVLFMTFISTVGTAFAQNSSFAIVNLFDPIYTQAIMVGEAIAGILTLLIYTWSQLENQGNGNTQASMESQSGNEKLSIPSFFLFFISSLASALALYLFNLLAKISPDRMLSLSSHARGNNIYSMLTFDQTRNNHNDDAELDDMISVEQSNPISAFQLVYQRLRIPALTIFLTFSISLQLPVFLQVVKPIDTSYNENIFILFALILWNVGDLFGRVVCGLKPFTAAVPGSSKFYLSYAVARFVFIPLFFLCNIDGKGALFNSDILYAILLFLFGFTNGHLSTQVMMLASTMNNKLKDMPENENFLSSQPPDEARDKREKEATGNFIILAMTLGLTCGSLFNFVLVYII